MSWSGCADSWPGRGKSSMPATASMIRRFWPPPISVSLWAGWVRTPPLRQPTLSSWETSRRWWRPASGSPAAHPGLPRRILLFPLPLKFLLWFYRFSAWWNCGPQCSRMWACVCSAFSIRCVSTAELDNRAYNPPRSGPCKMQGRGAGAFGSDACS